MGAHVRTIAQFIVALAAAGALLVSVYNAAQIQDVHISINSRMDQLLLEKGKASRAQGVEDERLRELK